MVNKLCLRNNDSQARLTSVGFVAAAVSMPMGGCRARRPVVDDNSLVSAVPVVVVMTAEPAVL